MHYYCYMKVIRSQRELLLQNRILSSRQAILDHCIEEVTKEVYENTAQLLSLARIQLLQLSGQLPSATTAPKPDELIGQVLKELRRHCLQLQWPEAVQEAPGFRELLQQELHRYFPQAVFHLRSATAAYPKGSKELRLFLFSVLLKVFRQLYRGRHQRIVTLQIEEDADGVLVRLHYQGNNVAWGRAYNGNALPRLVEQAGGDWEQSLLADDGHEIVLHLYNNRFV